jgi:hypothetical protein
MPPLTRFYLDLYNARTEDDLYQLMYAHAGAITRAAHLLRKVFPDWLKATTLHWQRYKRFVERWVRDELAEDDWRLLSDWLGSDVRNILECVAPERVLHSGVLPGGSSRLSRPIPMSHSLRLIEKLPST